MSGMREERSRRGAWGRVGVRSGVRVGGSRGWASAVVILWCAVLGTELCGQGLGELECDAPVRGRIGAAMDEQVDRYRVQVGETGRVSILVRPLEGSSGDLRPVWRFLGPDGREIGVTSRQRGQRKSFGGLEGGTYTVEVFETRRGEDEVATGPYEISMLRYSEEAGCGSRLACSNYETARIGPVDTDPDEAPRDRVTFRFRSGPGERLGFDLWRFGGEEGFRPKFRLYDPTGLDVYETTEIRTILRIPERASEGIYTLVVFDVESNHGGEAAVRLQRFGPTGSCGYLLTCGEWSDPRVCAPGETHTYRFAATAGGRVRVETEVVSSEPGGDGGREMVWRAYGPEGNPLRTQQSGSADVSVDAAGTQYVRVHVPGSVDMPLVYRVRVVDEGCDRFCECEEAFVFAVTKPECRSATERDLEVDWGCFGPRERLEDDQGGTLSIRCTEDDEGQGFRVYYSPGGLEQILIAKCPWNDGCNVARLVVSGDRDCNGRPDAFREFRWVSRDYGNNDGPDPDDHEIDWCVYRFDFTEPFEVEEARYRFEYAPPYDLRERIPRSRCGNLWGPEQRTTAEGPPSSREATDATCSLEGRPTVPPAPPANAEDGEWEMRTSALAPCDLNADGRCDDDDREAGWRALDACPGDESYDFNADVIGDECIDDVDVSLLFGDPLFRRGDANEDGELDIADAIHMLQVLFLGAGTFQCEDAADTTDDGAIDISDAVLPLRVLFLGQGEIPRPAGACGLDRSEDALSCASFGPCPF